MKKSKKITKKEKEKAEDLIFNYFENAQDACAVWELSQWVVSMLPDKIVKELATQIPNE